MKPINPARILTAIDHASRGLSTVIDACMLRDAMIELLAVLKEHGDFRPGDNYQQLLDELKKLTL